MPNHSKGRPTIRDVAAQAGVSHQTVSRVINADPRVAPETRARIEAVIARLSYQPNAIARSMAHGRINTLACIAPNLTDFTFASLIEAAESEARQHGYFFLSASAADAEAFAALTEQLVAARRVDGLMVINPFADNRFRYVPRDFPIVFVGARPRKETVSSVALDDHAAAVAAVRHLVSLGHRRIALLTGPLTEDCSKDRRAGYVEALREAGLKVSPTLVQEGDWSATSGDQAVQHWQQTDADYTALFAQNDRMAVGAIRALRLAGRRVPDDVSVIGVDDMPLASYFDPPLTTMHQDLAAIGRTAAQLLLRAVLEPEAPREQLKLSAELVVRQSTSPIVREGGGTHPR